MARALLILALAVVVLAAAAPPAFDDIDCCGEESAECEACCTLPPAVAHARPAPHPAWTSQPVSMAFPEPYRFNPTLFQPAPLSRGPPASLL